LILDDGEGTLQQHWSQAGHQFIRRAQLRREHNLINQRLEALILPASQCAWTGWKNTCGGAPFRQKIAFYEEFSQLNRCLPAEGILVGKRPDPPVSERQIVSIQRW